MFYKGYIDVGFCKTNVAPSQVNLGKLGPRSNQKKKKKTQVLKVPSVNFAKPCINIVFCT